MDTLSKSDARILGKVRYFTGKPCVNGHLSERYVNTGQCIDCLKLARRSAANKNVNPKITEAAEIMKKARERCAEIMATAEIEAKAALSDGVTINAKKAEALSKLSRIKVACAQNSLIAYAAIVGDYAKKRYPELDVDDVWPPKQRPELGVFYFVWVHADDVASVRQMEVFMRPASPL